MISVIIPTYNGETKIVRCLTSLVNQKFKKFDVVVVIDGSTDDTKKKIEHFKLSLDLIIIEQHNQGRSVAKNNGTIYAKNNLFLFLDDDMIANDNLIYQHLNHHLSHDNSILTGAYINHPDILKTEMGQFFEYLNKKWTTKLQDNNDPLLLTIDNYFIQSGNCSLNKNSFNKLNGFDIRLNDAEDYLLSVKALRENIPMYYSNNTWGYHYEFKSIKQSIKRIIEYNNAQKFLCTIDNEINKQNKYLKKVNLSKKKLFSFFKLKLWVIIADKGFLCFLPKNIRFKMYDIILTAHTINI